MMVRIALDDIERLRTAAVVVDPHPHCSNSTCSSVRAARAGTKLIAFLTDACVVRKFLDHLGHWRAANGWLERELGA